MEHWTRHARQDFQVLVLPRSELQLSWFVAWEPTSLAVSRCERDSAGTQPCISR
jgi:hypothetical protein